MNRRTSFDGARCLVTGASSVLGREFSRRLVHERARVILTGRTLAPLEAIVQELLDQGASPETLIAIDADLTEPEGRNKLIHTIDRQFGVLDLAINAAQVGAVGQSETDIRTLFEINVFALIELTQALLPLLQGGRSPSLVNFGAISEPSHPAYPASQAAIAGFTNSIQADYEKAGIQIFLLDQTRVKISRQKNPRFSSVEADLVLQALEAISLGRTKAIPRSQMLPRLHWGRLIVQFARKLFKISMTSQKPISSHFRAELQRLPRPHFDSRIRSTRKSGD